MSFIILAYVKATQRSHAAGEWESPLQGCPNRPLEPEWKAAIPLGNGVNVRAPVASLKSESILEPTSIGLNRILSFSFGCEETSCAPSTARQTLLMICRGHPRPSPPLQGDREGSLTEIELREKPYAARISHARGKISHRNWWKFWPMPPR